MNRTQNLIDIWNYPYDVKKGYDEKKPVLLVSIKVLSQKITKLQAKKSLARRISMFHQWRLIKPSATSSMQISHHKKNYFSDTDLWHSQQYDQKPSAMHMKKYSACIPSWTWCLKPHEFNVSHQANWTWISKFIEVMINKMSNPIVTVTLLQSKQKNARGWRGESLPQMMT